MTRTRKPATTVAPIGKRFTEDPDGWWDALMAAAESGELEDPDTHDDSGEVEK